MLFTGLFSIATILTATMFATKQSMLGFACAIFWALAGAQAFTLSTAAWDIYHLAGFSMLLGMVSLTALGANGLREKRDTIGDVSMEGGHEKDVKFFDEKGAKDVILNNDNGNKEKRDRRESSRERIKRRKEERELRRFSR